MKKLLIAWMAAVLSCGALAADAKPSAADLAGSWNGVLEFGKMKMRIVLHINKSPEGKISGVMDVVDQGVRGIPLGAVLYNDPDIRLEFDQVGANINGTLNSERTEIKGVIDDGPGGKPTTIVFKRAAESNEPKAVLSYDFKPGEPRDIRGYWKATFEPMSGMVMRLGLKIGRDNKGSFEALMDSLDQGAKDIPANSVTYTNGTAKIEWQGIMATLEAQLEDKESKLNGTWRQGPGGKGKTLPITFERMDKPAVAVTEGLSFEPGKDLLTDVRGNWEGALEIPDRKLRLILKVGRAKDGSYGGSMVSVDQAGLELPATSISVTNSSVHMEWKAINAKYNGTLTNQGKVMEGKWEQMGNPLDLRLERKLQPEAKKK